MKIKGNSKNSWKIKYFLIIYLKHKSNKGFYLTHCNKVNHENINTSE